MMDMATIKEFSFMAWLGPGSRNPHCCLVYGRQINWYRCNASERWCWKHHEKLPTRLAVVPCAVTAWSAKQGGL